MRSTSRYRYWPACVRTSRASLGRLRPASTNALLVSPRWLRCFVSEIRCLRRPPLSPAVKVADFDFHLPDELIAQTPRRAASRGCSWWIARPGRSATRGSGICRRYPASGRSARRQRHARLSGAAARPPRAERRRGRMPAARAGTVRERSTTRSGRRWCIPGQKLKPGRGRAVRADGAVITARSSSSSSSAADAFGSGRTTSGDVDALVDAIGHVPLPPYIHRPDALADRERYQTIFAEPRGSVAAPTAGLHFDRALLEALAAAGVERRRRSRCTSATARSSRSATSTSRSTSSIRSRIRFRRETADAINGPATPAARVIAVGTTTTRALEDAALHGDGALPRVGPRRPSSSILASRSG